MLIKKKRNSPGSNKKAGNSHRGWLSLSLQSRKESRVQGSGFRVGDAGLATIAKGSWGQDKNVAMLLDVLSFRAIPE